MSPRKSTDERIAGLTFSSVYPHYVTKIERKNRRLDELHEVINWLTGFDEQAVKQHVQDEVTFERFFELADLHPNVDQITGVICGYRVEDIENPLTQKVRYLDKLIDELAKGRKMEKILRVR